MVPTYGTYLWYLLMVPTYGTYLWYLLMVPAYGTYFLVITISPSSMDWAKSAIPQRIKPNLVWPV